MSTHEKSAVARRARPALEVVHGIAAWAERTERALDVHAAAADILSMLAGSVGANRGSLLLLEPTSNQLVVAAEIGVPGIRPGATLPLGRRRISSVVLRTGESLLLNGRVHDKRFDASAARDGLVSSLCIAIPGHRGVVGVLNLARCEPGERFSAADLASLEAVGRAVGVMFERMTDLTCSRRAWRDLTTRRWSPAKPELPAGEIETARLQGILPAPMAFESVVREDGSATWMLGRAIGQELEALEGNARVSGLFHARADELSSPRVLVSWMNETLRRLWPECTVPVWIGTISRHGRMRSCAAGGPGPFWLPFESGDWRRLEEGGPPLGRARGPDDYAESDVRMLPGDTLAVLGEGVLGTWSPDRGEFTGACFAAQALERCREPLVSQVRAWAESVLEHTGSPRPARDVMALGFRQRRHD